MKKINFRWSNRIGIGVMTGTSYDSIDISAVQFSDNSLNEFFPIANEAYHYPNHILDFIQNALTNNISLADISQLNFYISDLYARAINQFIEKHLPVDPDFVAVHGQTIWHNPNPTHFLDRTISSTFQAINLSALSKKIGIPVVGDFRSADIAIGGQGAPLVPIFDYHYFRSNSLGRVCVNIGGIANISVLPLDCSILEVVAYDCGPGNALLDLVAREFFDVPYDRNGNLAKSGSFVPELFDILLKLDSYQLQKPPKSTGKEHYSKQFLHKALEALPRHIPRNDILNTLTHYSAYTIAQAIKQHANPNYQVILSGGGVHNAYLRDSITNYLPDYSIYTSDKFGIDPDFKEAIAFAFLGYLFLNEVPSNVPAATGANQPTILGVLAI